jgi:hypothetical protein
MLRSEVLRSETESPELDRQMRSVWAYKARMRDEAKARKRNIIARIAMALVVIAGAAYLFLQRH